MPGTPVSSRAAGITALFDSTLTVAAASIDSGAGGFSTTFDHLVIYIYARTAEVAVLSALAVRFNNDAAANYDNQRLSGRNAVASAVTSLGQTELQLACPGASADANSFGALRVEVPAYSETVGHKAAVSIAGAADSVAANGNAETRGHRWRNTAAINRVALSVVGGSNLVGGTRLSVYAIG